MLIKIKSSKNVLKLESFKLFYLLSHQQVSKILLTFVPNRQLGQLITSKNFSPLKNGLQIKIIDHLK